MARAGETSNVEELLRRHLPDALGFARWLTRSAQEAEEVVQDACVKAWKYRSSFRGENFRGWFLTIVRTSAHSRASRHPEEELSGFDDVPFEEIAVADSVDPQTLLSRLQDADRLRRAMYSLPLDSREVLVLREIEGYSYQEIGRITATPPGTVMSRLARARSKLQETLVASGGEL